MKVMAIVASARKTGNSEILAKEMLAALPDSVEKKLLRLSDLNIEPCRACYACLPAGCECVIKDDFNIFLQQVREADAVIIASPLYFLGMHTRLKLLCDRLIAILNEADKYTGRRCVVAVPYGVEDWQGYGVEATVSFARFLHLDVVGVLPVHAANPGEAARPKVLAQARELAGRLLESEQDGGDTRSAVRQATDDSDITCAFCGSGVLRLSALGGVTCVICGACGVIQAAEPDGLVRSGWKDPGHFRYSVTGMREHAQRLENIKADFIARRHELAERRKPYKD
jgi:multimeric flavodoxin WrbA